MPKSLRLEHGTDIVEDDGCQELRLHLGNQMENKPAARGADEGGARDAERGAGGKDVVCLDRKIVVLLVLVPIRPSAAPIVECDDAPWMS